jgi:hypothetical protein
MQRLLYLCSALLVTLLVALAPRHPLVRLFALFFAASALFTLAWILFLDPAKRARTLYRLTTERVILFSDFIFRTVRSLELPSINEIEIRMSSDGTGTIVFDQRSWPWWPYWSSFDPDYRHAIAFEFIDGARELREVIVQAQAAARSAQTPGAA